MIGSLHSASIWTDMQTLLDRRDRHLAARSPLPPENFRHVPVARDVGDLDRVARVRRAPSGRRLCRCRRGWAVEEDWSPGCRSSRGTSADPYWAAALCGSWMPSCADVRDEAEQSKPVFGDSPPSGT
jgi:hypothetical protein